MSRFSNSYDGRILENREHAQKPLFMPLVFHQWFLTVLYTTIKQETEELKMKILQIIAIALIVSIVVTGCTGVTGNTARPPPPAPSGGGCGVAAPADAPAVQSADARSAFSAV